MPEHGVNGIEDEDHVNGLPELYLEGVNDTIYTNILFYTSRAKFGPDMFKPRIFPK